MHHLPNGTLMPLLTIHYQGIIVPPSLPLLPSPPSRILIHPLAIATTTTPSSSPLSLTHTDTSPSLPSHLCQRGRPRRKWRGKRGSNGAGRAGLLGGALLPQEGRHGGVGVQCHGRLLFPGLWRRHGLLPGAPPAHRQRAAHLHRLLRPPAPAAPSASAAAAGGGGFWGLRLPPQRGLRRRRPLPQCRRRRLRRDGVSRRHGPQGPGGGGRPRRLQGGARAGGGGRRRVRPRPDVVGGRPGAGVQEEAGGGHAVQEPDGGAAPPEAPQRPPLHAPLRGAQDQQDGQDVDPGGHHRLHEGAAGEDPAAAGGDGGSGGEGGAAAERVPGAQPQRDARPEHPQVRGGAQGGGRHPGGDLLRGQAGAAAVDGEHARHPRPRHPAVRGQLLQRLRHARLLLRDAEGDDERGRHQAGAVQERRLRGRLLVERRARTTTTTTSSSRRKRKENKVAEVVSCSSE